MSHRDQPAGAPDCPAGGQRARTLDRLLRHAVRTDLALAKVLDRLGVADPTEGEVDAALRLGPVRAWSSGGRPT